MNARGVQIDMESAPRAFTIDFEKMSACSKVFVDYLEIYIYDMCLLENSAKC